MIYTMFYTVDSDYLIIGFDGRDYKASIVNVDNFNHKIMSVGFNFCDEIPRVVINKLFNGNKWVKNKINPKFPVGFKDDKRRYLERKKLTTFNLFDKQHKEFITKLELTGFNFSYFKRNIDESEFNPDLDYLFYGKTVKRMSNLLMNSLKEKKVNYTVVSDYTTKKEVAEGDYLVVLLDKFSKDFIFWLKEMKEKGAFIHICYFGQYEFIDEYRDFFENVVVLIKC